MAGASGRGGNRVCWAARQSVLRWMKTRSYDIKHEPHEIRVETAAVPRCLPRSDHRGHDSREQSRQRCALLAARSRRMARLNPHRSRLSFFRIHCSVECRWSFLVKDASKRLEQSAVSRSRAFLSSPQTDADYLRDWAFSERISASTTWRPSGFEPGVLQRGSRSAIS